MGALHLPPPFLSDIVQRVELNISPGKLNIGQVFSDQCHSRQLTNQVWCGKLNYIDSTKSLITRTIECLVVGTGNSLKKLTWGALDYYYLHINK